jgi:hypothetical protein
LKSPTLIRIGGNVLDLNCLCAQGLDRVIFAVFAGVAPQTPIEHKTVMKKVNWLIEQNIYDRETEFLAQLQKQGYIYQETKYSLSQ